MCKLIEPDFADLHEEVFIRFSQKPDDLRRLDPRAFEILLDSIFKNNGFRTELGPGKSDGGVDIRLYTNDAVGEVVTLVQAKRYAYKNPIELQAVQALSAAVIDEKANRGLFVTTSRYLPVAKKFASRQNNLITLATTTEIVDWSKEASSRIIRDKASLVTDINILKVIEEIHQGGIVGRVYCARTGYNMIDNDFVLILKNTKRVALVLRLPTKTTHDHGGGISGMHVPILDASLIRQITDKNVFRVKMDREIDGTITLWGQSHLYSQWNGLPLPFDYWD